MAATLNSAVLLYLLFSYHSESSSVHYSARVVENQRKRDLEEAKPENSLKLLKCSRAQSRKTVEVLKKFLYPFLENAKVNLSRSCRLHSDRNMFKKQESEKGELHSHSWKCNNCKKYFSSERFLDLHFDNRHMGEINKEDGCLAELCPLVHCHQLDDRRKRIKKKCKEEEKRKLQHSCHGLANQCFPKSGGEEMKKMNDFFIAQFCDAHTCNGNPKYFPLGSTNSSTIVIIVYSCILFLSLGIFYVAMFIDLKSTPRRIKNHIPRMGKATKSSWLKTFLHKKKQF